MQTLQPVTQHVGVISRQEQYFWDMKYPTPISDQSVHSAVHLVLSNSSIPFSTSLLMCSLDSSKSLYSTPSQYQGSSSSGVP